MDIATILGIVAGTVNILVGILLGGSLMLFINIQSIVITVVGSIVSVVINYKLQDVLGLSNVMMKAVIVRQEDPGEVIALLVKFAERARREGILALEKQMEEVEDEFLRN
ncbi:motility protein A, partial [candidate division KSB1 bacterium]